MSVWEKSFIKAKPLEKDIVIIILFFVLILIVAAQIYNSIIIGNVVKEITPDSNPAFWFSKAEKYENIGEDLFRFSMDEFERGNYFNASDLCKNARSNFIKAHIDYLKSNIILKEDNKDDILTKIKVNLTLVSFERCEFIEAAMNNYLMGNYPRGNLNLELANLKNRLHDNLVEEYNIQLIIIKNKQNDL